MVSIKFLSLLVSSQQSGRSLRSLSAINKEMVVVVTDVCHSYNVLLTAESEAKRNALTADNPLILIRSLKREWDGPSVPIPNVVAVIL